MALPAAGDVPGEVKVIAKPYPHALGPRTQITMSLAAMQGWQSQLGSWSPGCHFSISMYAFSLPDS